MGSERRAVPWGDDDGVVLPIDPDLEPVDRAPGARRGRARPDVLAVIALGGMLGATARFELARALPTASGRFPWATFWTNLSGSFVLGFLLVVLLERFRPSRYLRPFLTTGIIGAYTTMSTYLVETALLLKDRHIATGLLYGLGSLVGGLLLAYGGIGSARFIAVRHHQGRA
jgi:CrcB protein